MLFQCSLSCKFPASSIFSSAVWRWRYPMGARSRFCWKLHPSSQAWPLLSTSNRGETAIAKCGNSISSSGIWIELQFQFWNWIDPTLHAMAWHWTSHYPNQWWPEFVAIWCHQASVSLLVSTFFACRSKETVKSRGFILQRIDLVVVACTELETSRVNVTVRMSAPMCRHVPTRGKVSAPVPALGCADTCRHMNVIWKLGCADMCQHLKGVGADTWEGADTCRHLYVSTRADTFRCWHVPTPVISVIWTLLGYWDVLANASTWKGADT